MVWVILIVLVLLGVFQFNYYIELKKYLVFKDMESSITTTLPLPEGTFTLQYLHSVHKTPVYEMYSVNDRGQLILTETRFSSLGVGMPYTPEEGTFSNEDGEFRITGLSRKYNQLPLRISSIPNHTVIIRRQAYPLLDFTKPDGLVIIRAVKRWVVIKR